VTTTVEEEDFIPDPQAQDTQVVKSFVADNDDRGLQGFGGNKEAVHHGRR
jgi:hypothetical protein